MTLHKLGKFSPDADLNRRLIEFQANVDREFQDRDNPTKLRFVVASGGYVARPGEMVLVDVAGSLDVLLATPVKTFEGQRLVVIARRGTAVLRPIGSKLNGAASASLVATATVTIYCADGAYYS